MFLFRVKRKKTTVKKEISPHEKELRKQAREIITQKALYYSSLLGVKYNRIAIKDTSTRWGSCSSLGNLNFSWRLILAPDYVLEYVVIHELCHLLEMNHSKAFWNNVASLQPSYKISRDWLKNHGQELMQYKP